MCSVRPKAHGDARARRVCQQTGGVATCELADATVAPASACEPLDYRCLPSLLRTRVRPSLPMLCHPLSARARSGIHVRRTKCRRAPEPGPATRAASSPHSAQLHLARAARSISKHSDSAKVHAICGLFAWRHTSIPTPSGSSASTIVLLAALSASIAGIKISARANSRNGWLPCAVCECVSVREQSKGRLYGYGY